MSGITRTVAMMYAVETHVISSMVAPTAPRICGSATLTIDESIVAMSEPNAIETVTSHLLIGTGAAAAGASNVVAAAVIATCPCKNSSMTRWVSPTSGFGASTRAMRTARTAAVRKYGARVRGYRRGAASP